MQFDRVFCTNSICSHSRASIVTGQYSQTNGLLDLSGNILSQRLTNVGLSMNACFRYDRLLRMEARFASDGHIGLGAGCETGALE